MYQNQSKSNVTSFNICFFFRSPKLLSFSLPFVSLGSGSGSTVVSASEPGILVEAVIGSFAGSFAAVGSLEAEVGSSDTVVSLGPFEAVGSVLGLVALLGVVALAEAVEAVDIVVVVEVVVVVVVVVDSSVSSSESSSVGSCESLVSTFTVTLEVHQ